MGSKISSLDKSYWQVTKEQLRACRSAISYQCRVCTADAETDLAAMEFDKDPTRSMSDIGLVIKPDTNRNKYF